MRDSQLKKRFSGRADAKTAEEEAKETGPCCWSFKRKNVS